MTEEQRQAEPDNTAVRTALWRALHVRVDAPPYVLEDEVGLRLAAPEDGWERRGDMEPEGTKFFRASIVARGRFVEDLVAEQMQRGVGQYVILGAGLDTFAQRQPELASRLQVFEVDQPGTQAWKRQRLIELGYGVPERLHLVPVNFEMNQSWRDALVAAGFDAGRPAVVASAGVSMYLTREAISATLAEVASLAPGSTLLMTFLLPFDQMAPDVQPGFAIAQRGAQASGTPFVSFFEPDEMVALALEAGFKDARHVSARELNARYFGSRGDGFRVVMGEELLLAST
ncbi:class I SAM-dependent methyltransferase [bacterium]|nr:class I SAM-dependent methyltransferase [bacterium]